jgi:hypothetical protein
MKLGYQELALAMIFFGTQIAFAAASDDFNRAAAQAADAAEKTKGGPNAYYPVKVAFSVSNQVIHAMQDCGSDFPIGSSFDLVLIVSTSGQVERVVPGPLNSFGKCIESHLQLPKTVAKPPGAGWPVHLRALHGRIAQNEVSSVAIITDNAGAPAQQADPASAAYVDRVTRIERDHVIPALQKDVQRWGTSTIRILCEVDRSGQMHDLRVICKDPNPWAEETIRHALKGVKFPPIPPSVLKQVHSDHIDVTEVLENKNS